MKKLFISLVIVFFMISSVSINNLSYLTDSSYNSDTIVYAKGSSGGFKSGGFSSGSSGSKSYKSGTYSAPKSNTTPKSNVPPVSGGNAQTAPRTSFMPFFIPMPFGFGGGFGYGGFGMYNPFAGIIQLIILIGIIAAVIWFIRKRRK